jgi:hypothetical protein
LYYVRIELGGSGVRDDSLRIVVSVPQLSGRLFDGGVIPNPPLTGVDIQIYGPNGYITTQSNSAGNYVMPGLVAGTYNMFLRRTDFLDAALSVTVGASGSISTFTALSNITASTTSTGGLDLLMSRSSVLLVLPSLSVGISTQSFDQWGSLQVRSSTASAVRVNLFAPLRLPAGTTTFDDGGQWDPSVSSFVARTLMRFALANGTYTVSGSLPGVSPSSASVYVGPGIVTLNLPAFSRKSQISGLVSLPAGSNPNGVFVSVNAVPLSSSALATGGFGGVFLDRGVVSGTYTVTNLDPGSYLLRANVPIFTAISTGPITVVSGTDVANVNFPAFSAGASISGVVTVRDNTSAFPVIAAGVPLRLSVNAWSPGSLNFGSTVVVVAAGLNVATPFTISGLSAGATYQIFANLEQNGGASYFVPGGLPLIAVAPQAAVNFSFDRSSGTISGTIVLPAGATDFLSVSMTGITVASARPDDVGRTFSIVSSTSLPNFRCQPANVADTAGFCPVGNSTATFTVQGLNTETDDLRTGFSGFEMSQISNAAPPLIGIYA